MGFLNHAIAPIKHADRFDMNKNNIENASADSLLRFKTENMLISVASLVPIPEIDTGINETKFAVDIQNATFTIVIETLKDIAIK